MVAITLPSPVYKNKAILTISEFQSGSTPAISPYYRNISKLMVVNYLKQAVMTGPQTANRLRNIINQGNASLCGPAALMYSVFRERPDLFVQIAINLYSNGKAKLGSLELYSSNTAKNHTLASVHMHYVEWMLLSSVIHNYDTPKEQWDGITRPSVLAKWYRQSGYSDVLDDTKMVKPDVTPDGFERLVKAQRAYTNGYNVCLLIYMDLFISYRNKRGFPWHGIAEHWVVLNGPVQVRKYNHKTKLYAAPIPLSGSVATVIANQLKTKYDDAVNEYDELSEDIPMQDKVIVNAFTWGKNQSQAQSKLSASHEVRLDYFLSGYFGYIKAKR